MAGIIHCLAEHQSFGMEAWHWSGTLQNKDKTLVNVFDRATLLGKKYKLEGLHRG